MINSLILFEKKTNSFKVHAVIGVLGDDVDPMVAVMKLEKAPKETYADIGGLTAQIQEIKVCKNSSALFFCLIKFVFFRKLLNYH